MQESIQLQDIFGIIKKRLSVIVSITILSVFISGIVSYFWLTPIYEASSELLINQKSVDLLSDGSINVRENLELINTYRGIIKSPVILEIVKSELNLATPVKQLSKQVGISSEPNSQIVTITVQDEKLEDAVKIANSIASTFMNEILVIMNIDNVTILSLASAEDSNEPVKPRILFILLITFTLSLLFSIALVCIYEYFDDTIKDEQYIITNLELPVLGAIPVKTVNDYQNVDSSKRNRVGGKRIWGFWHFFKRKTR